MKETRVQKYQQYRKSILKDEKKGFFAPSKDEKISTEMGIFLKIQKRKRIDNIMMIAIIIAIISLIVIFGFILF